MFLFELLKSDWNSTEAFRLEMAWPESASLFPLALIPHIYDGSDEKQFSDWSANSIPISGVGFSTSSFLTRYSFFAIFLASSSFLRPLQPRARLSTFVCFAARPVRNDEQKSGKLRETRENETNLGIQKPNGQECLLTFCLICRSRNRSTRFVVFPFSLPSGQMPRVGFHVGFFQKVLRYDSSDHEFPECQGRKSTSLIVLANRQQWPSSSSCVDTLENTTSF